MKFINTLREGEQIREIYFCKQAQSLKTKAGKTYMSLTLQDKTGTLDAKIWDLGFGIDNFDAMDYIYVEGQVTVFQSQNQLNISRLRKASDGEYNEADYLPCSRRDVDEMYKELLSLMETIKNTYLKKLLHIYFVEDKDFIARFKKNSAAKTVHHNFIGGLVEHTLGVAKMCDYLAKNYDVLNRDLLITAAIFHDLGKTKEISLFPENDYTDEGNLLGHIYMGAQMLSRTIENIDGFPKSLEDELLHCILAHHGELEYGSPKKPALVEALALSMADNLDAKLESMRELFSDPTAESGWLGYQKMFETNVRKTIG